MNFSWNPQTTDKELHSVLRTLAEEYPLHETEHNATLIFESSADPENLHVTRRGETWIVEYGRIDLAARGFAYVLSEQECAEKIPFKTFGILFDCTRGNVITVKHFKFWLRRLAMMGYNMAMIYVKDAYQLKDEPYFGYMRGAYTMEEIREIDSYAKKLKIEMIASIQALGHVEPLLRWPAYAGVKDTSDVLLVDEPATYDLLKKMITFWSEALSSRRIHLGMDETQTLGRGRFQDIHGYEDPFAMYNRHLGKVCDICKELKLEPIIWSDMYFRYSNISRNFYDTKSKIPESVKKAIPSNVQLSYWDYYHRDEETYVNMLNRTRELNKKDPIMASGIWTWARNWTDFEQTFATVRPCIAACRKTNTREIIFTLWGDDGGYCDFDSALAGLAWSADFAFNPEENGDRTARFYEAVCGTSYTMQLICGNLTYTYKIKDDEPVKVLSSSMLWDDPLMGIVWNEFPSLKMGLADTLLTGYRNIMETLEPHRGDTAAGNLNYAWNLANVLVLKIEMRQRLLRAYYKHDFNALETISERYIPDILDAIDGLQEVFRIQWKRSFKSFGLELMQIRLAGLSERYRELSRVIEEMIHGEIDSIPELEVEHKASGKISNKYLQIATGNFFI